MGRCFVVGGLVLGDLTQVGSAPVWTAIGAANLWLVPRAQANALANARRARDDADHVEAGGGR